MYVVGAGSDIAAQRKGKLYITLIQEAQLHPTIWLDGWLESSDNNNNNSNEMVIY